MNQILITPNKKNENEIQSFSYKINKNIFKFQFVISIFLAISLSSAVGYYHYSMKNKEKISNKIIDNYNITRLYSNNSSETSKEPMNNLFGIIEIPKLNIYYPVFSTLTDEQLKISPCKFYGETPQENSNICIAGHNYNNSMFFSTLSSLKKNDAIYIYDNLGNKYNYYVFDFYEVAENDLSPIFDYENNIKQLTLVTCNNFNSSRLIVKAKQKEQD